MSLTHELRKLAELHQSGHLSAEEFAAAKQKLLAEEPTEAVDPAEPEDGHDGGAMEYKTYHSSRWSSGNLFFRDSLTLSRDGILFRKGALFGSSEEHINYRAVASCKVANGIFLANVTIETSGGSQPIFINGLWKADAKEIQDYVRAFQRS